MPAKSREYYLTTSSSRDFTWFFFRPPNPRRLSTKLVPPSPNPVPKARRTKVPSTTEPRLALMAPVEAKSRKQPSRSRAEPAAKSKKQSKPKRSGIENAGPWSDWYLSEDGTYLWRARVLQNETWDYQYDYNYQELSPAENTTPITSNSEFGQPPSPSPGESPADPKNLSVPTQDPTSPKSSLPTILTTSTGHPTEGLSASTSRTLVTLPKEVKDASSQPEMALIPFSGTRNLSGTKGGTKRTNSGKSPVLRLLFLQEGRSRKSRPGRADSVDPKSAAGNNITAVVVPDKEQQHGGGGARPGNGGSGAVTVARSNRTSSAFAKKLHAKVKSEKELRMDPKKRVRTWLKGVELDWAPIPLDIQGFPIYQ
ncbi:hypothetical protein C7999DRAFT_37916 [Corynascus novoguineensis]|uniref:Uncharacterized protein n=1 Tax=Corynascus novoguineensis TaxID=1126955 RepID=A0AAN7HI90_9PEZI|nr:hypothetical protein C7999DRAFT_37916 [Corynascus novoguineensis]